MKKKKQTNHSVLDYLTMDVPVKFSDEESRQVFISRVASYQKEIRRMANDVQVQKIMFDLLEKDNSEELLPTGWLRDEFLKKVYEEFPHYMPWNKYHRTTVVALLQSLKAQRTLNLYLMANVSTHPQVFGEFAIFGYAGRLAWLIAKREGVSLNWAKEFVRGRGRLLETAEIEMPKEAHFADVLKTWFNSLEENTTFERKVKRMAAKMTADPEKVFRIIQEFHKRLKKPSENWKVPTDLLEGSHSYFYQFAFDNFIGTLAKPIDLSGFRRLITEIFQSRSCGAEMMPISTMRTLHNRYSQGMLLPLPSGMDAVEVQGRPMPISRSAIMSGILSKGEERCFILSSPFGGMDSVPNWFCRKCPRRKQNRSPSSTCLKPR